MLDPPNLGARAVEGAIDATNRFRLRDLRYARVLTPKFKDNEW